MTSHAQPQPPLGGIAQGWGPQDLRFQPQIWEWTKVNSSHLKSFHIDMSISQTIICFRTLNFANSWYVNLSNDHFLSNFELCQFSSNWFFVKPNLMWIAQANFSSSWGNIASSSSVFEREFQPIRSSLLLIYIWFRAMILWWVKWQSMTSLVISI